MHAMSLRHALSRLIAVLAMAVSMIVAGHITSAEAAYLSVGATTDHPFSNPVWWPLSTETRMDCYSGNPGCRAPLSHTGWLMDVVSTNVTTTARTANEPVFAMGAGIVHYGVSGDQGCGGVHGRGNWLYIDHGNGVLSYYGHLYWPFSVHDGQYVTPRTQVAMIGNSGYSNCLRFPRLHYIDIAVKYGGTAGRYVQVTHSFACVRGIRRAWPQQMSSNQNGAWQKWNDIPASGSALLNHPSIIPASDTSRSCVDATPKTAPRAFSVALRGAGAQNLRVTWPVPRATYRVRSTVVVLQEWHPAISRWLDERVHLCSPTAASTSFTGLQSRRLYRARVMFRNGAGYSAPSAWHAATSP